MISRTRRPKIDNVSPLDELDKLRRYHEEMRRMIDRAWEVDTTLIPHYQHWRNRACHCTMTLPGSTIVAEAVRRHRTPCVLADI